MAARPTHYWTPEGYTSVHHGSPRLLVGFRGAFDDFLRRIDVGFLARAWHETSRIVSQIGLDPNECRWGWAHPGVMGTVGERPAESPLDGFGWLLPPTAMRDLGLDEVTDSDFWKLLTPIDELLSACDPPLLAVYSHYRCAEYLDANEQPLDPADAALGLTLTFGTLLGDMSEWRPRDDAGTGPWADIAHAMLDRDVLRYHEAFSAAFREYTIAGAEIVTRGFGDFLLAWCRWEAPKGIAR